MPFALGMVQRNTFEAFGGNADYRRLRKLSNLNLYTVQMKQIYNPRLRTIAKSGFSPSRGEPYNPYFIEISRRQSYFVGESGQK